MAHRPILRAATTGCGIALFIAAPATAGVSISQGGGATTYAGYAVDFDEALGPIGFVSPNAWESTDLVTIDAVAGTPEVGDFAHLSELSFRGASGVTVVASQDMTALSFQAWTDADGAFRVRVLDDGAEIAVLLSPEGLANGDWFDVTTIDGSVFDTVEIVGLGDGVARTDVDNLSWNTVYTVAQAFSAPTYVDQTLDFDEAGGPTGSVSADVWQPSHGITINNGLLQPFVGQTAQLAGFAFHGMSGVNMYFDRDVTSLSFRTWTNAGGGYRVRVFDDGEVVAVFLRDQEFPLAFGDRFDITTSNGVRFDEVEVYGYGAGVPRTDVDDLSWDLVAVPSDVDGDGATGFSDLTKLLAAWGDCVSPCPEDIDNSTAIGFSDLTIVLSEWGS